MPKEPWKGISPNPELVFEHDDSHWKYLGEQNMMMSLRRGLEVFERKRNFDIPSFRCSLKGLGVLHKEGIKMVP